MNLRLLSVPLAALLAFVPGGCSPQKPSGGAVASPPSPVAAVQPPAADRDDKDAQKRLEPERKDDSKELLSDKSFKGFGVNGSVGGRLGNRMARGGGPLSALHWLARHQSADGRWSSDSFGAVCRKTDGAAGCDGAGLPGYDVGVTGLALYAFLDAGFTPKSCNDSQGIKGGEVVKKGLAWLMGSQGADGCIGGKLSPKYMLQHAIAALALSAAGEYTGILSLKASTQKAVDFIVQAQNPGAG